MRKLYVAVDFDGTLAEIKPWQDGIGPARTKIIELVKKIKAQGHKIILWTCRDGIYLQEAVDWCATHGIVFDYVNENPESSLLFPNTPCSRKMFADWYLDDKTINVNNINMDDFELMI